MKIKLGKRKKDVKTLRSGCGKYTNQQVINIIPPTK